MVFEVDYWDWWVLAVMLWGLKWMLPKTFFGWAAIIALLMGILMVFFPNLALGYQLIIFAFASIIIVIISRLYWREAFKAVDKPFLNQPGAHYIGRQLILTQAIVNGQSQMNIDGHHWKLKGPDCAAGTTIKVVGIQGHYLKVELVKGAQL